MNATGQRRLIWLGAMALLGIIWITAVQFRNNREIKDIAVYVAPGPEGKYFVKEGDIRKVIQTSFGLDLQGKTVAEVELGHIEQVMEAEPYVKDADVYIDGNGRLSISIRQREPIVRVIDENGGNYYLDEEGKQMPMSRHYTARVPVMTGQITAFTPDFRTTKRKTKLKEAFELIQIIRKDDFYSALVEQIHLNSAGEFILLPKIGEQRILLGDLDHVEEKLHRLELFYKNAMPYTGWNKYAVINLKYDGQIVCK